MMHRVNPAAFSPLRSGPVASLPRTHAPSIEKRLALQPDSRSHSHLKTYNNNSYMSRWFALPLHEYLNPRSITSAPYLIAHKSANALAKADSYTPQACSLDSLPVCQRKYPPQVQNQPLCINPSRAGDCQTSLRNWRSSITPDLTHSRDFGLRSDMLAHQCLDQCSQRRVDDSHRKCRRTKQKVSINSL
jgi:hypothetical protein